MVDRLLVRHVLTEQQNPCQMNLRFNLEHLILGLVRNLWTQVMALKEDLIGLVLTLVMFYVYSRLHKIGLLYSVK